MCLAIPARVTEIEGEMAVVEVGGVLRRISLLLLDDVRLDDYVIVHAGFAIHKVDESEAQESIKLLREMALQMTEEA